MYRVIGGIDMLIAQATQQIVQWTRLSPDREVMRKAAKAMLEDKVRAEVNAVPACGPRPAVEAS